MAEETSKSKRVNYQRFTPEMFALYLLNVNPVLTLPFITADRIKRDCKDLNIGVKKIDALREHPEFVEVVRREFLDPLKDKDNMEKTFYVYLTKCIEGNLEARVPSYKILEILGFMTGKYSPKKPETKEVILTPKQKAMMEHAKEEADAAKRKREGGGDGQ
jgi:hypothetical protein